MIMDFSKDDTVCIYSDRQDIVDLVTDFGNKVALKIFKCETEEDLIAVPCLFSVIDINKLDCVFFEYLDMVGDECKKERYITYTIANSVIAEKYLKYFIVNPSIKTEDLKNYTQFELLS